MKPLLLLSAFLLLILPSATFAFEDCDPSKGICQVSQCSAAVIKEIDALSSATCKKWSTRPYPYETNKDKWTTLFYELEVITTIDGKVAATKFRVKDI